MKNVDLNIMSFDYGLTFAALLMNADGKVYSRFGGRDSKDPMTWISMKVLINLMKAVEKEHKKYLKNPNFKKPPKKTIADFPAYRKKLQKSKCVHCHQIHDAMQLQLRADGKWTKESLWYYPEPKRVGIEFNKTDQNEILEIIKSSAASKAGLKKGDVITEVNGQKNFSISDFMHALENTPNKSEKIKITYERKGKEKTTTIKTMDNWKEVHYQEYAWRPTLWPLSPKPGFGGPILKDHELKNYGLKKGTFAFKVRYIVTWGDNSYTGRNAMKAGIRRGDLILSVDGKSDFKDMKHFHAWFRFTRKIGSTVTFKVMRKGKTFEAKMKALK